MHIIITGASSGIGYEVVKHLAKEENHTILCIARRKEKLEQLQQECRAINNKAVIHILPIDLTTFLTKENEIKNEISKFLPSVEILINNAGKLINNQFIDFNYSNSLSVFQVNYFVPAMLSRVAASLVSKKLHILNIGSMGGFQGSSKFPGLSHYSSSKAAMASLTECMAEEFKEEKISVNCLAIGAAQTEMLEDAFPGMQAPLSAADMAEFISYFSTKGDRFFNGKVLPVALSTP